VSSLRAHYRLVIYCLIVINIYVCVGEMQYDPNIRAHVDFRVKMTQNDDNHTPNMAQDDDMSSDDSRTLTPPPPPLPPTPSPPPPPRFTVEEEQTRL